MFRYEDAALKVEIIDCASDSVRNNSLHCWPVSNLLRCRGLSLLFLLLLLLLSLLLLLLLLFLFSFFVARWDVFNPLIHKLVVFESISKGRILKRKMEG